MFEEKIKLTDENTRQIISEHYDLGDVVSITPLESGHESDNVKFSTSKGDYVLKLLFFPRLDIIQNRMQVLELLHEYGIKVPIPIKTKKKNYVAVYDENNLLVVLTFIPGKPIFRENKELMYSWMKWFGKQIGIFHNKSKQIPFEKYKQKMIDGDTIEISLPPGNWIMERYNERNKLLPNHKKNKEIIELFEKFLQSVEETDFSNLTSGIRHGDMMPANFFKEKEELMGILDIGGGYSFLMADIARWIMYTKLYISEVKDSFVDFIIPYLEYSKIPVEELKTVPILLQSTSYVQYFYFAYRIHNNITQGYDDEEDPIEENWKGFTGAISFVELIDTLDDNYFYDLAIEVLKI